jgi:ABC-type amino acid transport substrate-binding protein
LLRLNTEPFSYKDENGEITGLEILMVYGFTKDKGYAVNLKGANTYPELIESIKSKSADAAGGLLPIKDEYRNEITYSAATIASPNFIVVRYENL